MFRLEQTEIGERLISAFDDDNAARRPSRQPALTQPVLSHPHRAIERHCCICREQALEQSDGSDEHLPATSRTDRTVSLRGLLLPARCDRAGRPLVPRFGLSYRDVEELLAERGVAVDHITIYRWVQRFTLLLAEAARPCRHGVGDRWQVDETM